MTRLPQGKTRLDLVREAAANQAAGPTNIKRGRMVVSLDRLSEDPNNERRTFRQLDGLVDSIKAVGIVEPITVSAEADGSLRIVTGHRRFRAAKLAGLTQVEVIVRDSEDEKTRRLKSIISNAQREDIGIVEMAEALQSMFDDGQFRFKRDLARAIGKAESWVSEILGVLQMPTDLLAKVRSSQQPVAYDAMTKIARISDPATQREMVNAVLSGSITSKDLRAEINRKRGKPVHSEASAKPKPKRVFHTSHKASVIVQADGASLNKEQVTAALHDALDQAIRNGV